MSCEGWTKSRLKDLTSLITKGTTPTTVGYSFTDVGVNFVKSESIGSSKWLDHTKFVHISNETNQRLKRSILQRRDVLLSMAGAYLGKTAMVCGNDLPANTNQAVAIIRLLSHLIDPDFVYYFFNIPEVTSFINQSTSQSAQPNINLKQIGDIQINYPPLPEQRAIARILSSLDDKIELNNRMNKTLEEMAQTIFKRWFVDFEFPDENGNPYKSSGGKMVESELGLIPEGWRVVTLNEVCSKITDGVHNTVVDDPKGNYLLLSCKNIKNGAISTGLAERRINEDTFIKLRKRTQLERGDILLSSVGTIGELALLIEEPKDYEFQRSVAMIKPNKEFISPQFLYESLNLQKAEIIHAAHGAVQQCLFLGDIKGLTIQLPCNSSINDYSRFVDPLFRQISRNRRESVSLTIVRDTLLPKLMSGEIRVPVTED